MPPEGVSSGGAGQKRPADDGFDPLISEINTKATPRYDSKSEEAPSSVTQSEEWATYKSYEDQIKQLLMEPASKFDYKDKSIQGLVDVVNDRIGGHKSEKIIICLTGAMGMGK